MTQTILTVNAGSSSIKYKAYAMDKDQQNLLLSGLIEGIGENQSAWHHQTSGPKVSTQQQFKSHEEAFRALAEQLKIDLHNQHIDGIGHRVVHGGELYYKPTIITKKVLQDIEALSMLAPIHNPVNAEGIRFAMAHYPKAVHVAIFDSGFHHTMPEWVKNYAIHKETADRFQIRRYGFHGINHEYVATVAADFLDKPLSDCQFISLHLGNGASACLIKSGRSADTSMGLTPLPGLVMGTRCGDIDPAIVIYLQERGLSRSEVDQLLNKQSGLKGIANDNDMRHLIQRAENNDKAAQLAIEMYVYAIQKMIGAYYSQLPKLDALIFTGGIGENASLIREKVITPLKHLQLELNQEKNRKPLDQACVNISKKGIPILVISGDEEALIAQKVYAINQSS